MNWKKLVLIIFLGITSLPCHTQILTEEEKAFLFAQIRGDEPESIHSEPIKHEVTSNKAIQGNRPIPPQSNASLLDESEMDFFRDIFNQEAADFRFHSYLEEKKSAGCFTQVFLFSRILQKS